MENQGMSLPDFLHLANRIRKENLNKWVTLHRQVEGKNVGLKFYNFYNQIIDINRVRYMGVFTTKTIKAWKKEIETLIKGE